MVQTEGLLCFISSRSAAIQIDMDVYLPKLFSGKIKAADSQVISGAFHDLSYDKPRNELVFLTNKGNIQIKTLGKRPKTFILTIANPDQEYHHCIAAWSGLYLIGCSLKLTGKNSPSIILLADFKGKVRSMAETFGEGHIKDIKILQVGRLLMAISHMVKGRL